MAAMAGETLYYDPDQRINFLEACKRIIEKGYKRWSITEWTTEATDFCQAVLTERYFSVTIRWEYIPQCAPFSQVSWVTTRNDTGEEVLRFVAYADKTLGFSSNLPRSVTKDSLVDQIVMEAAALAV